MDILKAFIGLGSYAVALPFGMLVLARYRRAEDAMAIALVFLLGLHIDRTIIMMNSIEWYRGTTKGFEFSMMNCAAIALIGASLGRSSTRFRWFPLLTALWFVYVGISSLSIISAINREYVLMSIFKFAKVWLLAVAIGNYVRTDRHVHVVLHGAVIMIVYQFFFVAKMKWLDGIYQVRGLFEHQNPLAMFTYMCVLPLLAVALSPSVNRRQSWVYLLGFACGAVIVLATLSRASLLFFAVGALGVIGWGFLDRVTLRRVLATVGMAVGGVVVLAVTLPTIIARFHDEGNEASGETRVVMNLAAKAMRNDKAFGVGWNNFALAINHPYPYGDVIDDWNLDRGQNVDVDYAKGVVESHYWLLMAENGYPGFIAYLLFLVVVQFQALVLFLRTRGTLTAACAAGIFIGFGLNYTHSTLERVLTQTKNLGLWMVLIGLLAALWINWRSREKTD
jgi:hypothetical protein